MAVHQCAQFCLDPKLCHKQALKQILQYLKKMQEEGLLLKADCSLGLECYVDADFAGTFNKADAENPRDCFSCTGYLIEFAGCPLM